MGYESWPWNWRLTLPDATHYASPWIPVSFRHFFQWLMYAFTSLSLYIPGDCSRCFIEYLRVFRDYNVFYHTMAHKVIPFCMSLKSMVADIQPLVTLVLVLLECATPRTWLQLQVQNNTSWTRMEHETSACGLLHPKTNNDKAPTSHRCQKQTQTRWQWVFARCARLYLARSMVAPFDHKPLHGKIGLGSHAKR